MALGVALLVTVGTAARAGELARLHALTAKPGPPSAGATSAPPAAPGPAAGADAAAPGLTPLQPLPTPAPLPRVERLGLEALPCRGTCPAFTVIFAADGTFAYVGEANVERLGEHTGRVDMHALRQVMRYVEAIGFASLADTYPSSYADVRTSYTLVDWGDSFKVVEDQGGSAPVTVWALERLLLQLLDEADWD